MSDPSMTHSPAHASAALAVRDPWALVPSLGNLDAYISAVNRLPIGAFVRMTEARVLDLYNDPVPTAT